MGFSLIKNLQSYFRGFTMLNLYSPVVQALNWIRTHCVLCASYGNLFKGEDRGDASLWLIDLTSSQSVHAVF